MYRLIASSEVVDTPARSVDTGSSLSPCSFCRIAIYFGLTYSRPEIFEALLDTKFFLNSGVSSC